MDKLPETCKDVFKAIFLERQLITILWQQKLWGAPKASIIQCGSKNSDKRIVCTQFVFWGLNNSQRLSVKSGSAKMKPRCIYHKINWALEVSWLQKRKPASFSMVTSLILRQPLKDWNSFLPSFSAMPTHLQTFHISKKYQLDLQNACEHYRSFSNNTLYNFFLCLISTHVFPSDCSQGIHKITATIRKHNFGGKAFVYNTCSEN